jgi:DNA repair ATPase RecN
VVSAGVFTVKVSSSPRGVARVNGRTVSIAKLEKAAQTVVEVKKPGEDTGMTVRLAFRPN